MNISQYRPAPNTTSTRNAKGQTETVVYWVNAAGHMIMPPHNGLPPFRGYRAIELKTRPEIEAFSRRFAKQEADKIKHMKVEEHLRGLKKREMIRSSAKLRIAQSYSKDDVEMNQHILKSLDRQDADLFRFIKTDSDMVNGTLMIEKHDAQTIKGQFGKKPVVV